MTIQTQLKPEPPTDPSNLDGVGWALIIAIVVVIARAYLVQKIICKLCGREIYTYRWSKYALCQSCDDRVERVAKDIGLDDEED